MKKLTDDQIAQLKEFGKIAYHGALIGTLLGMYLVILNHKDGLELHEKKIKELQNAKPYRFEEKNPGTDRWTKIYMNPIPKE